MTNQVRAVCLDNVSKYFGHVRAVDRVSLSISDGEFFSLLGPSGCGKTTTLRMIAGFEIPTAGTISIQGRIMGDTPPYRRPVNTVFQNYALFPHMTVARNIAFGLEMQKVDPDAIKRRVREALELVLLPDMGERKPDQLSGGQRQRIALARALVNRPQVLLLDEPLGALDLKLRKAMQLELKALQNQVGITFIYVTHDQEEALTMSDRIAVMDQGSVLQVGSPEEIYDHPSSRFVADFIGETNFLEGEVVGRNPEEAVIMVDGELPVRVPVERSVGAGDAVTIAIRPEKITLHAQAPHDRSLAGSVEGIVYTGNDTRYLIRLTRRTVVTVRHQNVTAGAGLDFPAGTSIHLSWQEGCARLLTA
jgi:spermidine/putrescine transport system ATP-binding protein